MSLTSESTTKWQPRPRIRPRRSQLSTILNEQPMQQRYSIIGGDARTHGPSQAESGLVVDSTRPLKFRFAAHPHTNSVPPPSPPTSVNRIGVSNRDPPSGRHNFDFPCPAASSADSTEAIPAQSASVSVQSAFPAVALFSPTQGIPIRHEYLLEMSKKSKRLPKAAGGGVAGGDIMDSLVSSIDEIESKQMRGLCAANGHRRQRSESIGSVISVSPAPVIQTSKSSTRSPSGGNKLSRRSSTRSSSRETNGRHNLRSSSSQEHWSLPPIEQEDDIFSVPTANTSYSSSPSNNSVRHGSVPARTSSITLDIHPPYIPPRANSLLHSSVPPPIMIRPSQPRRSENMSDIPSYITRYLRDRTDSKENISLDIPISPRRPPHSPRNGSSRSRNSTTAIPGSDQYSRFKSVTKRQSSQGFERDLSATRHYYSLPPPSQNTPRRSSSLRPSRSSVASDGSTRFSQGNDYVQEVLNNPKLTQRIQLTNGRVLSFSEVGDEHGWPVFCFTGMGLNRLVAGFIRI